MFWRKISYCYLRSNSHTAFIIQLFQIMISQRHGTGSSKSLDKMEEALKRQRERDRERRHDRVKSHELYLYMTTPFTVAFWTTL